MFRIWKSLFTKMKVIKYPIGTLFVYHNNVIAYLLSYNHYDNAILKYSNATQYIVSLSYLASLIHVKNIVRVIEPLSDLKD